MSIDLDLLDLDRIAHALADDIRHRNLMARDTSLLGVIDEPNAHSAHLLAQINRELVANGMHPFTHNVPPSVIPAGWDVIEA